MRKPRGQPDDIEGEEGWETPEGFNPPADEEETGDEEAGFHGPQSNSDRTNRPSAATRRNEASKDTKAKGGGTRNRSRSKAGGHK
jgi:hypothetical protein